MKTATTKEHMIASGLDHAFSLDEFIDESMTPLEAKRYDMIVSDPIVQELAPDRQREAIQDTFELYLKSKDVLAPVVAGFASELLDEAGSKEQVIFAARDGLGAYEAAKNLLEKFPDRYETANDQLAYAYFTRNLTYHSSSEDLREYVGELGMDADKPTLVADVGMYGSIQHELEKAMPNLQLRYLISRNSDIPGYMDDGQTRRLSVLRRGIPGNPAIHFLEDTFSGTTSSPAQLVRGEDGRLTPDLIDNAYEPAELLRRKYAVYAFGDYVAELSEPPNPTEREHHVAALDQFLSDEDEYRHLMVPHIR